MIAEAIITFLISRKIEKNLDNSLEKSVVLLDAHCILQT